jgi:hypothetical protein
VKESPEGGYEGKALGFSIFAEGDTYDERKENIRHAIHCHFEEKLPKIYRVHFTREEVFAA